MRPGVNISPEVPLGPSSLIDFLHALVSLQQVLDKETVVVDAHFQQQRPGSDQSCDLVGIKVTIDPRHNLRPTEIRSLDAKPAPGIDVGNDIEILSNVVD